MTQFWKRHTEIGRDPGNLKDITQMKKEQAQGKPKR